VSPAKTAEPVQMQFVMLSGAGPENHVLHGSAHWYNLANTIEPFVCGGDAVLCQITLTTCYYYVAAWL